MLAKFRKAILESSVNPNINIKLLSVYLCNIKLSSDYTGGRVEKSAKIRKSIDPTVKVQNGW